MRHIVVVGGGHAGCEAALAAVRAGRGKVQVTLFAMSLDSIALMPCNPCIGGSAKGHLVREIDALGGEMGRAIDATFLQSRMLNASKGPAVYSLRAQADKKRYMTYMKQVLEREKLISLREGEVVEILTEAQGEVAPPAPFRVRHIRTESGAIFPCDAVIICTGTYLNARCLYGKTITHTGPGGSRASTRLSQAIQNLGFPLQRFKTGTPARVHRRSINFSQMAIQHGDKTLVPFSFETDPNTHQREQIPCYLTYTTPQTHEIIRRHLHRSAMYSGLIDATGTRYCPSIEDKIVRFADKERHPVFIEPEGADTEEMYIQGMSSALPEEVQVEVYRSVPGLENCEIMRPAYAIEYDCIDATQLTLGLEAKAVKGLFFAGQINGSSGYEEAAAQGLIAGANAAGAALHLTRAESYIGVLIDDLVTKGTPEPYRMMTSRAEYRLLLRQDNADLRLTPKAHAAGLIPEARYAQFCQKRDLIEAEVTTLKNTPLSPETANPILKAKNSSPLTNNTKAADLIKRPEITYDDMIHLIPPSEAYKTALSTTQPGGRGGVEGGAAGEEGVSASSEVGRLVAHGGVSGTVGLACKTDTATSPTKPIIAPLRVSVSPSSPAAPPSTPPLPPFVLQQIREQVNIQIKYEGYINMQIQQAEQFIKAENHPLPNHLNYEAITNLRLEARQKLNKIKPANFGQASRITGVSPADLNILMIYLKAHGYDK